MQFTTCELEAVCHTYVNHVTNKHLCLEIIAIPKCVY